MNTILKNVLQFSGLVIGVPVALPHLLNVNSQSVIPQLVAGNAPGFTIAANATTVTVTRTSATGNDSIGVYVEHWHTIEAVTPPGNLLGLVPFIIGSGGTAPSEAPLIAAATLNAFGGGTPGIEFLSNFGFTNATRSAPGTYELTLANPPPNIDQQVVNVTRRNSASGEIQATVLGNSHIQINNFDLTNVPADTQFFITVHQAPLVVP